MFEFEDIITFDRVIEQLPGQATKMESFLGQKDLMMASGRIYKRPTLRTVVTGTSDYSVTEDMHKALRHVVDVWYTTNKQTSSVRGFPLGVCELTPLRPLWEAMNLPKENRNLVYMNFTLHTNPIERQPVWDMFKDKSWVTTGQPLPQDEFYKELRHHRFCLCPPGNGIDTYRLWESIYVGTIPIVKRNLAHSDWMELPVLWIDDWSEVTPEFLESVDMSNRPIEKAKLSYWVRQIKQSQRPPPIRYALPGHLPIRYTASSQSRPGTSSPP